MEGAQYPLFRLRDSWGAQLPLSNMLGWISSKLCISQKRSEKRNVATTKFWLSPPCNNFIYTAVTRILQS